MDFGVNSPDNLAILENLLLRCTWRTESFVKEYRAQIVFRYSLNPSASITLWMHIFVFNTGIDEQVPN